MDLLKYPRAATFFNFWGATVHMAWLPTLCTENLNLQFYYEGANLQHFDAFIYISNLFVLSSGFVVTFLLTKSRLLKILVHCISSNANVTNLKISLKQKKIKHKENNWLIWVSWKPKEDAKNPIHMVTI